jgi:AcrR family transcriptional regulator
MAQRKKDEVRTAILEAAFDLFAERGYSETSIPLIARRAGFSTANVYIYFQSKIEILFTLYEPWLQERLDRFEASILRIKDPRKRLERILMALWRDLPRDSNGFANNVMQAVSTSAGSSDYSPRLRELFQARVAGWIASCMHISIHEAAGIAAVVLMAFDGFAMNVHLAHGVACDRSIASRFGALLVDPGRVDPGRMP